MLTDAFYSWVRALSDLPATTALFISHRELATALRSWDTLKSTLSAMPRQHVNLLRSKSKLEEVRGLLEDGTFPSSELVDQPKLLKAAIEAGNIEFMEFYISLGITLDAAALSAGTPLIFLPIADRRLETLAFMFEHGVDPNETRSAKSLLSEATADKNYPLMELLLQHGALVDNGVDQPFCRAIRRPDEDALAILLRERGFKRMFDVFDSRGITPLEYVEQIQNELEQVTIVSLLTPALDLAQLWDRRMLFSRVGLAAADKRVARAKKR